MLVLYRVHVHASVLLLVGTSWIKGLLVVAWLLLLCILVLHGPWLGLGLSLLIFAIWQFSALVYHQVDLGSLHFTCHLLDMLHCGLWALIFLFQLAHLASWKVVQVQTTFIYGLGNKLFLMQKEPKYVPMQFQVGILPDWFGLVHSCTIHPHFLAPGGSLSTLPKCDITKWNDTPIRMLLINIQSMKSKINALLHHITLNDIDICLITETWIQTDQDLQILDANI